MFVKTKLKAYLFAAESDFMLTLSNVKLVLHILVPDVKESIHSNLLPTDSLACVK